MTFSVTAVGSDSILRPLFRHGAVDKRCQFGPKQDIGKPAAQHRRGLAGVALAQAA